MHKEDIKHLNSALKGEHMAIESFDYLILDTPDAIIKDKLMNAQRHHKNQATRIAEKIQHMGGKPQNNAGITGTIYDLKQKLSPKKHDEENVLTKAIDGEKMGIDAFKKIMNDLHGEDNIILIKDMMIQNQKILEDLITFKR